MLTSIQLSDMDLTTHSKSSFSSQKTNTPTKLLSLNHMKASVQKKKKKRCIDRLSVLCILNERRASGEQSGDFLGPQWTEHIEKANLVLWLLPQIFLSLIFQGHKTARHPCSATLQSVLLCEGELLVRGKMGKTLYLPFLISDKLNDRHLFNV